MKILQINAVYGIGSTGRTTKELDEALIESRHESLIAATKTNIKRDGLYIIGNKLDWKLHGLLSRLTGKQGYFSKYHTKKLIGYIKNEKPDVIHLRNLHANYINLPILLNYLAKNDIAVVITLHDLFFFTGKCTHYISENCYKWQSGCYNCPKLKSDNKSWFFDRTKTMWQDKKKYFENIQRLAVIGVSDWTVSEAKKSFLKDAKIIKRIYNWIDLNVFYPRTENVREKYKIPEDKFIILSVSSGWQENSDKFRDVLKLSEKLDDTMCIVLVGQGLRDISLPLNITGIDYINGADELSKIYSNADVYVHFSYQDTFGKVVAEALACGTPAIVYNRTALPELVPAGCGYVIPPGDIGKMYSKLKLIKSEHKNKYSEICVSFIRDNFSKKALIDEYIQLYMELTR